MKEKSQTSRRNWSRLAYDLLNQISDRPSSADAARSRAPRSSTYRVIVTACLILAASSSCLFLSPAALAADGKQAENAPDAREEDGLTPEKGLEQALGALGEYFKDMAQMEGKSTNDKIAFIMSQTEGRIFDLVGKAATDAAQSKISELAKAQIRAETFWSIAAPALKDALKEHGRISQGLWDSIEAQRMPEIENRAAAVAKSLTISVDILTTYVKEGPDQAFKKAQIIVVDETFGKLVPNYAIFKAALSVVEGVRDYVLAYAFETARQGINNDVFGSLLTENPQQFLKDLRTKNPAQLRAWARDQYELAGKQRLYAGRDKFGDESGDPMFEQVVDALMRIRSDILLQEGDQRRAELAREAAIKQAYADAQRHFDQLQSDLKGKQQDFKNTIGQEGERARAAAAALAQAKQILTRVQKAQKPEPPKDEKKEASAGTPKPIEPGPTPPKSPPAVPPVKPEQPAPPKKPAPPAAQPPTPEKPLPNCKDVPDGTRCKDDTPTTGPESPSTCPEGMVSTITIDAATGKGRQTGCRPTDPPLPPQGSAPGVDKPSGGSAVGQSAEEKRQAEEDAAWAARVAEMDAAAAQEKKRKDDAWKQQQDDWKQFGYQPPDVKIVGPVEKESSWGLVLALNKPLRESLSSMYAGLAGRKASIDRMSSEYEQIGSSLAKRLESSGAGSCFDAVQASQALPTKDISAGKMVLAASDPDELTKRLATMEKLHSQIAGVRIVSAEQLQKKVEALSVAISAYNQELQKPEVRKWLKIINDNREILVSMSQAQVDSGRRPTGLDPAEMPDFGGAACGQAMRQMENINARIQVLRNAVQTRQQLLGLAKPILDRMRQIEAQIAAMKSGKLGIREIAAVRAEFVTAQGKSVTSTTPGKAFALYERARSGTLTSDVATMIVQALDLSDRINQQVAEVTHEAGKKAVVVELEKLLKQIANQPPTRAMLDNAAELARLGQVGGEPEVQALMQKLSANSKPSAAEKASATGPSGLPLGTDTVRPPMPPPSGSTGSRPSAATSGMAAPASSVASTRESADASPSSAITARPLASARMASRSDSIGDTAAPEDKAAPPPPGQEIAQIRELYQKFVQAYQAKNLSGVVRAMSPQWQASDGSGLADLEDTLRNSFRVFDVIQFRIDGLQVQKGGTDTYNVSYAATLSGRINRLNIKHEETSNVQDVVKLTPDGPRIVKTQGNVTIKAK